MTENFKFPTGVRPLTLGNSFKNKDEFCTIRYDFRPETEAFAETSTLTITDTDQVTLTQSGTNENASQTQYKGSVKPYEKECILIVNNYTGEIRLEKLSRNIQLKKTRIVQHGKHSKHHKNSPSQLSPMRSPDNKNFTNVIASPVQNSRDSDLVSLSVTTDAVDDCSDSSDESPANKIESLFTEMKEPKQLNTNSLATAMHNSMSAPISDLSGSSSGDSSDSEDDSSSSSSSSSSTSAANGTTKQLSQQTDNQNGNISPFFILDDDLKLSESESDSD